MVFQAVFCSKLTSISVVTARVQVRSTIIVIRGLKSYSFIFSQDRYIRKSLGPSTEIQDKLHYYSYIYITTIYAYNLVLG